VCDFSKSHAGTIGGRREEKGRRENEYGVRMGEGVVNGGKLGAGFITDAVLSASFWIGKVSILATLSTRSLYY
jgi:hypothetical protein